MKKYRFLWIPLSLILLAAACTPPVECNDVSNPFSCAEENPDNWYWIDVAGMQCRDGSATGIGVRLQRSSNDLVIYLEGGGAYWDDATCADNPSSFSSEEFRDWAGLSGYSGIFNSTDQNNAFDSWNVAYIPYCTGDVHSGNNTNVDVPGGPAGQQFVGHTNVSLALDVLQTQFPDPNNVLLVGASAGGYGTVFNYAQVVGAFPDAEVSLINDSGPLLDNDDALSMCNLDSGLKPACLKLNFPTSGQAPV